MSDECHERLFDAAGQVNLDRSRGEIDPHPARLAPSRHDPAESCKASGARAAESSGAPVIDLIKGASRSTWWSACQLETAYAMTMHLAAGLQARRFRLDAYP
jgi:hypothetical protein